VDGNGVFFSLSISFFSFVFIISSRLRIRPVETLVGPGEISLGAKYHIVSFVGSKYRLFRSWHFLD
jgi:hypothetical protein